MRIMYALECRSMEGTLNKTEKLRELASSRSKELKSAENDVRGAGIIDNRACSCHASDLHLGFLTATRNSDPDPLFGKGYCCFNARITGFKAEERSAKLE